MNDRRTRAVKAGGLLGALAAGAAAGVAMERLLVGRERLRPDPEAREPFGRLPGRDVALRAEDGVALYGEQVGSGPLTVVFCHGFALSLNAWHYQRRDLADVGRLVFYDHRSHGRSGRGSEDTATIDQLGRDLGAVVDQVSQAGPVALVGHSMGGMTIMSLAHQRPELFGSRVVGVALIGTSSGGIAEALVPLPVRASAVVTDKVFPRVNRGAKRRAALIDKSRRIGTDLNFVFTKVWGFGSDPSPAQVEFVERMIAATPMEVIAQFSPTFIEHDKAEALNVLGRVPTLVVAGDRDRLTPIAHARKIHEMVPGSELVVFDGAGHMVLLERAPLVNLHLRAFLRRVAREARGGRARRA